MKRAFVEALAIAACIALGVLAGRAYDPTQISWAAYLALVFAVGAVLLVVLIRLERHFDSENATDPAGNGAGSKDSRGGARGVDC